MLNRLYPVKFHPHFDATQFRALTLIVREIVTEGTCTKTDHQLSADHQLAKSTLQAALRKAKKLGIIEIEKPARRKISLKSDNPIGDELRYWVTVNMHRLTPHRDD